MEGSIDLGEKAHGQQGVSAKVEKVVGDAGLVRPLDLDAWADALDVVAARSGEMRSAGRRRAGAFTTEHSGAALAAAYDLAVRIGR